MPPTPPPPAERPHDNPYESPEAPPPPLSGWQRLRRRANRLSSVIVLLAVLVIGGGIGGYLIAVNFHSHKQASATNIEALSPAQIQKLSNVSSSLGSTSQTLNIGASTLFRSGVNVAGDLTVGGHFSANGPVTLSQLNITGSTSLGAVSIGNNLNVSGSEAIGDNLTVTNLLAVNGGLNVTGTASVTSLNAATVAVKNLSVSGPVTLSHLVSAGGIPEATAGSSVGNGGTISISGNDTAGTININTGSDTVAGTLATITFRTTYGSTVHVVLTPLTGASSETPVFVTRSSTGFVLHANSPAPTGAVMAFDYIVVQ